MTRCHNPYCRNTLTGRQRKWCSDRCRVDFARDPDLSDRSRGYCRFCGQGYDYRTDRCPQKPQRLRYGIHVDEDGEGIGEHEGKEFASLACHEKQERAHRRERDEEDIEDRRSETCEQGLCENPVRWSPKGGPIGRFCSRSCQRKQNYREKKQRKEAA